MGSSCPWSFLLEALLYEEHHIESSPDLVSIAPRIIAGSLTTLSWSVNSCSYHRCLGVWRHSSVAEKGMGCNLVPPLVPELRRVTSWWWRLGSQRQLRVGGEDPNSNPTDLGWALSFFLLGLPTVFFIGPARRAYRTRPTWVKKTLPKPKLFDTRSPCSRGTIVTSK